MILRLALVVSLGCLAAAGPVAWDDSKCSQECNGGSKYQYSPQNSYTYDYESSNELKADRTPQLLTTMKATVKITVISKCEMVMELTNVQSATASFAEELQKNPLPFSFNDGAIDHVCPNPEDSDDVNNIKKGILSSFQNSMRSFDIGTFHADTNVLGTCDTTYKSREIGHEKFEILKKINIPTCSNHLKGHTLLLASFYKSSAYHQHLPLLTEEKASCKQIIDNGIVEEVTCDEVSFFKPSGEYGYIVQAIGHSRLKKAGSDGGAPRIVYKAPKKESLVFKYHPHARKNPNAKQDAKAILQHICENSKGLISKQAAHYVHKLVYTIRQMDAQSVEEVYTSLKNNEICPGKKPKSIYVDALKAASSGGSIALLSKLATRGEISQIDSLLWLTLLPFTSYVEADSISSALPLLRKGISNRQTLLGITALAYKYCYINPDCESTQAIKDLSSTLKQFLGDKCAVDEKDESEVMTALKAFGNLGFVGDSAKDLFECALNPSTKTSLRIAAIDSFRRSPCKEDVISKLLEVYSNNGEHDEVRIAALVSLSKCAKKEVIKRVVDTYSNEPSAQVQVFTWSFLENLKESSDPVKAKVKEYLALQTLKKPSSVDITKFSRHSELSFFSEIFNLGLVREANLIHSADSFLPRSGNVAYKLNLFGNQMEPIEVGARIEDLEHILEKLFGPVGIFSNINIGELLKSLPENSFLKRLKRSAENYESKIESISERFGYKRNKVPRGTAYMRVLGHEIALLHLNEDSLKRLSGLNIGDLLKHLANLREVDISKNLLFLEVAALHPSLTGKAYKLAGNSSLTVGLKGNGKIDLRQPTFPIPKVDIDGIFEPSALLEETATFTIHSEDYAPGVKAEMVLNAGLSYQTKLDVKDGRLVHVKLGRNRAQGEIISFRRKFYYMNQGGTAEMEKVPVHNFNYCTKYVQKITGSKYCGSLTIPHAFENGKFKMPFVREMEASLSVEHTDPQLDEYEFILELPELRKDARERKFKILLDVPKSSEDRKFSLEIHFRKPDDDTCHMEMNLHTPFYKLDSLAHMVNREDQFRLNTDITGDGKRRYSLSIDAAKVIKGARLVEYQPKISLSLPSLSPVELTGTLVFSRGRKTLLSVNLESGSFSSPFTIKGSIGKEGETIDLSSNWKLNYEFNTNMFSQIHRIHNSISYDVNKGLFLDLGHHFEPDGRSYESVTANVKVENIKIFERLGFDLDSQILFAEHQDLNTMLKWHFSFKPLHHLDSDLIFRYGENFQDDTHLVRSTIKSSLHGDFNSLQKFSFENKVGLTISCLNFDKSASLSAVWDLIDEPKLIIDAGIKTDKDKEIKFDFNYRHLEKSPLKLATDFTFTYNTYKFIYRDEAVEIAPKEFEWKSVIEPAKGKQVTTDFIYRIKSDSNFHHELEGSIKFPGLPQPIKHKGMLKFSDSSLEVMSNTDFGRGQIYIVDLKFERNGVNAVKLNMPFIDGHLDVDARSAERKVSADFRTKGRDNRRIILNGKVTPGDTKTLDLDVQWDADADPDKKVTIHLTSHIETEEGIEKYIIGGSVNYGSSIDISGTISTDLIRGPHFFRVELSGGNMEPMAIEIEHEIKDGHMNSITRYLRSGVEKIRSDIKGKLIIREFNHIEIEGGILTSSPYKTFDGKSLFFRFLGDSTDEANTLVSEYRMKFTPVMGYEGKVDYTRKRTWPGNIRSNLVVKVHNKPLYEGSTNVDYGNGKYSWKTSFTPVSKRKINFFTTFEHNTRFASFHHSLVTSLKYLQTIDINAVADLRNMEDAKVHSNIDVNSHKLYDVNGTLKMRSVIDFDAEGTIFSKITPSLKVYSKAQTAGQITKYDFNLNVDSKDVITGSGEIKKKKRGFNGDLVFKYKEKEMLHLTINQDGKGKHERYYVIKSKFPSRLYTANIKVNREKKGSVNYETKFCRNEDLCVEIDAVHKEYDNTDEYQITYRRDDIEFSLERIRQSSKDGERFHTVIYNGDNRYGYDVRVNMAGPQKSLSLGIILPSREIITKSTVEFSLSKPRLILELSADGRNHPERKLVTDLRFENHLFDSDASKVDITVTHPIFEKPIEIKLYGDYESSSSKFLTAGASLDYSNDPEDKLISKLSMEQIPGGTNVILINLYHKDDKHLDFVIKMNATSNENEESFAVTYNWKEDNVDKEAYLVANYLKNEKRFYFAYERPKMSYRLDGKITSPESLLNETCLVDLESVYNGETTRGKLISNYETGCHKLKLLNEGEVSRFVEVCFNPMSRKMVSVLAESLDDEGNWIVDYLLEVVKKDWNTIGFRSQVNPDFLGAKLFVLTALLDELDEAGVGSLPFYDSPRFKIIRKSFNSKVFEPAKQFVIPEAQKFIRDVMVDTAFLRQALMEYYSKLPSLHVIRERIQAARQFLRSILFEIWSNIYSYYENYLNTALEYVDKAKKIAETRCQNNNDCRSLVEAYKSGGWKSLIVELRKILLALPGKIQEYIQNPSVEVQNYMKSATNILKALLQPLTKYKCGELVIKVARLSYEALQPRIQELLQKMPHYYRHLRERLISSPYYKTAVEIAKRGYFRLREEILNIDYQRLIIEARKYFENYLTTLSPPSTKDYVTVNAMSVEKGLTDIDIHSNVATQLGRRVHSIFWDITTTSVEAGLHYNWNTILIKFKRGLNLGFIPPYDVQAMIVGHQHIVTFDKLFYDFAGECSYLLSRDFEDGNFTVALKPKEGDHPPSVLVLRGDTVVELTSGDTSVKVGDNAVELPYLTKQIAVTREGSTIVVNTKNGLKVKCSLVHHICTFVLSGWYYGKTAGLLGTYNYEKYDEFKRPKGQIANNVNVFAKSWELKKGCKTNNLVPDVQPNKNSDSYKLCHSYFVAESSPLAACFSEVSPDDYFRLCQHHVAIQSDKNAFCNVATAYVTECEKNYVELNLPAKCLTCNAPDGSKLEHGDRKKFESLNKKSTDTVFIVEDHDCNKVLVSDLANLARSIERELQNEGFKDNMFSVVGYGGDIGEPQIFTAKDKIFFGSKDINSITARFKMESKKVEASRALESIKHAVTHLSRSDTAKSFVLLSCSACKYDLSSLQYPVVQQILLERGISLHIIKNSEIPIRKSSVKEKNIIGVDPDTVYHTKDVTQRDLIGEPNLRSQVVMPKDLCIALSQDVNGSFFSTHPISRTGASEVKNWRNVFARKFLKSTQLFSCQWCDCTSTRDHLPNTVCQPCEMKRPRLPFSVGTSNAYTRTLETFLSYLLHLIRQ